MPCPYNNKSPNSSTSYSPPLWRGWGWVRWESAWSSAWVRLLNIYGTIS